MKKRCMGECGKIKDVSKFSKTKTGYYSYCKECKAKWGRQYRKNNPKKVIENNKKQKEYYKTNREQLLNNKRDYSKKLTVKKRIKIYNDKYYEDNKENIIKQKTMYHNKKMKESPEYRLNQKIKGQIYISLKKRRSIGKWEGFVGYTLQDLMNHLESLFKEGMTFENYGEWHIDHKKPKCLFHYTSFEDPEFKKCWALENLQPLWKEENLSKGAKYFELEEFMSQ